MPSSVWHGELCGSVTQYSTAIRSSLSPGDDAEASVKIDDSCLFFFFFNLKIYVQINEVFIVIFSGHHMSLVSGSADLFVEDTLGLIH